MRTCITSGGFHLEDASQAAEKRFPAVILSMDSRKRLSMLRMTAPTGFSAASLGGHKLLKVRCRAEARLYENHRVPGFSHKL
jgi:hypothetical protein